uniref:Uncharacterized protein n=1 Tax=Florenciella sp. virus SA2 TaxID=3240092 RepID=A0AB39JBD6_9VIRU
MNTIKKFLKIIPEKQMPLGRWCHPQYVKTCSSKMQDRKAELANIDNSLDVRTQETNIKANKYDSSEDMLLTIMYNKSNTMH